VLDLCYVLVYILYVMTHIQCLIVLVCCFCILIASVRMYFDLEFPVSMYLIAGLNEGVYFVCYDSYPVCNCFDMLFLYADCIY
jgi:hypothetical protein